MTCPAFAAPEENATLETREADRRTEENGRPWHLDLGVRSNHPRLSETKSMLYDRLDKPLRLDWAHVFDHPYTPIDRDTDWGYGSLSIGFGRQESDWLVWTAYGGGSWGSDRNFDRFLTNTLEVNFEYHYFYLGGEAEVYPWRVPQVRPGMAVTDLLLASRPFLLSGLETGYVSGEGEGTFRVAGVPTYRDSAHVRDWVASFRLGLGWNFPLSQAFSVLVSGDFAFNFYRPDEYNGWQVNAGLRYRF